MCSCERQQDLRLSATHAEPPQDHGISVRARGCPQDNAGSVPSAPGAMPVPVLEEAPAPAAAAPVAKGSKRKLADREPAGKQSSGESRALFVSALRFHGACITVSSTWHVYLLHGGTPLRTASFLTEQAHSMYINRSAHLREWHICAPFVVQGREMPSSLDSVLSVTLLEAAPSCPAVTTVAKAALVRAPQT